MINRIVLEHCDEPCSLGGKSVQSDGSHELQKMQLKIAELESENNKLEKKNKCWNSFMPFPPSLATSSLSHSRLNEDSSSSGNNSSSSSVMEETLKSPSIGPTLRKRKVAQECRKVAVD